MRWTVEEVRRLEVHEFDELILWLQDEAKQATAAADDIDMDAMLADKMTARGTQDEDQDD